MKNKVEIKEVIRPDRLWHFAAIPQRPQNAIKDAMSPMAWNQWLRNKGNPLRQKQTAFNEAFSSKRTEHCKDKWNSGILTDNKRAELKEKIEERWRQEEKDSAIAFDNLIKISNQFGITLSDTEKKIEEDKKTKLQEEESAKKIDFIIEKNKQRPIEELIEEKNERLRRLKQSQEIRKRNNSIWAENINRELLALTEHLDSFSLVVKEMLLKWESDEQFVVKYIYRDVEYLKCKKYARIEMDEIKVKLLSQEAKQKIKRYIELQSMLIHRNPNGMSLMFLLDENKAMRCCLYDYADFVKEIEPNVGVEPTTCSLQKSCSTN